MDGINSIASKYKIGQNWFRQSIASGKVPKCSPGYVSGHCSGGHKFAHFQFCGKEYCKNCSMDGSPIHQRRVSRWWPTVESWSSAGYLVVTIPEMVRPYFFDREVLRDFRHKLLRKLKEDYKISAGLCRWHWFGDCELCNGNGCTTCNHTGSGDFWHPHLNILWNGGFIPNVDEYLSPLRRWIVQYIVKIIDAKINHIKRLRDHWDDEIQTELDHYLDQRYYMMNVKLVLNYSYVTDQAMKMNRVKYITRSTFRRFNYDVKSLLYNFRNAVVWGWKKNSKAEDEEEDQPIFCPVCAENGIEHKIRWGRLQKHSNSIIKHYGTKTGGSIYRIRSSTPDDDRIHFDGVPIDSGQFNVKELRRYSIDQGIGVQIIS